MHSPALEQRDPLAWCAVVALGFLALAWHRLGIPPAIYFDEIHYVPAARKMLEMVSANPEHPLLGKEIIAASIWWLGDKPFAWRLPSALFGAFGLFAFGRLVWWASLRRFAAIAAMLLLATSFAWFVQSRIAMLDMMMAGLGMTALWQLAVAARQPARMARWRLMLAGVLLGLAMGTKWSIAPAAMLPGLAFLVFRFRDHGRRLLVESGTRPLSGIALWEAALWLGVLPLAVYWATYWRAFVYPLHPTDPLAPLAWHRYMLDLQDSVTKLHPYRSIWPDWMVNWRAVWYFFEPADRVQRYVLLVGNPFSMLAGLPALLWCLWAGLWRRRDDALVFAALYLASLGMWAVTTKPIQFYYHYLLPGSFLMGCLALALDQIRAKGGAWRWLALALLAVAIGMFIWFYPVISAADVHGDKRSYLQWTWLDSWI
jgi:dolichyl-phosphate-mannose-protein mannosyltransferase